MHTTFARYLVTFAMVSALTLGAAAAVVPALTFRQVVRYADVAFVGEVVNTESRWEGQANGRVIVTAVTFRVDRVLKGPSRAAFVLEFLGGQVGHQRVIIPGAPSLANGDSVVVCARDGDHVSPIVGFNQGLFRVTTDRRTGIPHVTTHDGYAFSRVDELSSSLALPSAVPRRTMTLAAFEDAFVREVHQQSVKR